MPDTSGETGLADDASSLEGRPWPSWRLPWPQHRVMAQSASFMAATSLHACRPARSAAGHKPSCIHTHPSGASPAPNDRAGQASFRRSRRLQDWPALCLGCPQSCGARLQVRLVTASSKATPPRDRDPIALEFNSMECGGLSGTRSDSQPRCMLRGRRGSRRPHSGTPTS